ncbi:hypothetical protein ABIA32_002724 [Streptacidiphilus sp. MAP12-20]|uniref:hypothetical protein n=1 Tax=Streptacidiphilus sp. MAP12-20 TaxID=3156299 RepID=UPI003512B331
MNHLPLAAVKPIGTLHLGSLTTGQIWTMWGVLAFVTVVLFGVAFRTWQDGLGAHPGLPITFNGAAILSGLGAAVATAITVVSLLHGR